MVPAKHFESESKRASRNASRNRGAASIGKWSGFNDNGAPQTPYANGANEITSISSGVAPVYDKAGNMTTMPKPDATSTVPCPRLPWACSARNEKEQVVFVNVLGHLGKSLPGPKSEP